MRKYLFAHILPLVLFLMAGLPGVTMGETYEPLPGPGKKCWIGKDYYFTYSYDKKPQMGTVILKVELFDKDGKQDTTLKIAGNLDMPSMKGAHGSGEIPLKLNKKGEYLLALNIVMPGEWEVQLTFGKDAKVLYRGSTKFHV
jgi:hypothetical protein